jgi:2-hydroxychromene-2-carboxylate isomerase
MADRRPLFVYDFNSPYAYLAATRVHAVLGDVRWQPVGFAFILRAQDRLPWSFDEAQRRAGVAECERRAHAYGLAPMRWPRGWPIASYGLGALRAALVADAEGLLTPFSRAAFERNFVHGLGLTRPEDIRAVAADVGLDPEMVMREMISDTIKQRLTTATEEAIAAGVPGVPTVIVDGRCFWGDDQLEAAAAAR